MNWATDMKIYTDTLRLYYNAITNHSNTTPTTCPPLWKNTMHSVRSVWSISKKNGEKTDEFLRANHKEFKVTQKKIEALGYREMTEQQYSKWLNDKEAEKNKQRTQNNTDSKL